MSTFKWDDLIWRIFFQGSLKKCESLISFKRFSFLINIRITKVVSIFQEYPIMEQWLKFPRFLCFLRVFFTFLVIYFTIHIIYYICYYYICYILYLHLKSKTQKSQKMFFYFNFCNIWNPRSKNKKNGLWQKNYNFMMLLNFK